MNNESGLGPDTEAEILPKKEKGRNVSLRVYFLRHGEKEVSLTSGDTGLSDSGLAQARQAGEGLEGATTIKSYSSGTDRAKMTADGVVGATIDAKKLNPRVDDRLGFHYNPSGDFIAEMMRIKAQTYGEDFAAVSEEERIRRQQECVRKQMEYYLSFKDARPDPGTFSPVETAAALAQKIDTYIRMADRLDSSSKVDLVNVTHDFNLAAFLHEIVLCDDGQGGRRKIESSDDFGGYFDYMDGLEILISTDESGEKKVSIAIIRRNEEGNLTKQDGDYAIDPERFSELLEVAKKTVGASDVGRGEGEEGGE